LALARLAANRGLRTVVVDLDLASPQLAQQLGLRPELGWDDVQAERLKIDEALIESIDDRVTLLPLRNGYANPRALAGTGFLRDAVERLRAEFDVVLLDVGPLEDDGDTIDLAAALGGAAIDDALVIRDRRRVTPQQLHDACRRAAALGVRRWDVVENFTEIQGY
jgi:Mrp family chromosome partitioning ATPase